MESLKAYVDLNLVSLVVSYAIIVGAAVVKLPQIFNVLRAGTAKGLSLPAVYLETVATLAGTIYNVLSGNPFRTYGETALILVQNLVIVVLIWSTTAKPSSGYVMFVTSAFVGIGAALWNVRQLEASWPQQLKDLNLTPLDSVQAFMTILYIVARVPQILQNFAQGHTGVLSVVTLVMNVGGNVARLGTSLKEGLAPVVIYSFVLNGFLNGVLFLQVVWFWKATAAALKKGAATPAKGSKPAAATPASEAKSAKKQNKTPQSNNGKKKAD